MTNIAPQISASVDALTPLISSSGKNEDTAVRTNGRRRLTIFGLALLGLAGGAIFYGAGGLQSISATETPDVGNFPTTEIADTPFRASLQAKGTVDSSHNITLKSEVRGFTTILSLLPQGTKVGKPTRARVGGVVESVQMLDDGQVVVTVADKAGKQHEHRVAMVREWTQVIVSKGDRVIGGQILAGDVVCELDSSQLIESEKQEQIYVTNTKANLEMAKSNLEIRTAQNESLIAAARLRAELTALDLDKYLSGTFPQQREKLEGEIRQNQEDLARSRDIFDYSQRLQLKGYKSRDDVESARLKVLAGELKLSDSAKSLNLLESHSHDRTLLQLTENAADAKRDLRRIELQCEAAMAQLKSIALSRERVYNIYRNRLQKVREQIRACKLVAPHAGQVVHANVRSSNSSSSVVEEGMNVRERQDIVHLPDLSSMKVDVDIHESVISRIRQGQAAEIWIDALPGVKYRGRLVDVSSVPLPGRYPYVDRKLFAGEVVIETADDTVLKLRPGMTARVELIVAQSFENVPQIPQEAVVSAGNRHFTWVIGDRGVERRPVTLGMSNDRTFVVEGGVRLGEQVVLNPREYFGEEIETLEFAADDANAPPFPAGSMLADASDSLTGETQPTAIVAGTANDTSSDAACTSCTTQGE